MSIRFDGEGAAAALNQLAREQAKHRLLTDIRTDLTVCEIEGWSPREYLRDIHELVAHFDPCELKGGAA